MKKTIKKLAAILLSAVMLFVLCGCDSEPPVEIKTVPVPSSGWTIGELLDVTYLYGHKLSNPPVYGDFGSKIKMDDKRTGEGSGTVSTTLYYGNAKYVCEVYFTGVSWASDITDSTKINIMIINEAPGVDDQLSLNGVTFGDSPDTVLSKLGEPKLKGPQDSYFMYFFEKGSDAMVQVKFFNGKMFSVTISNLAE